MNWLTKTLKKVFSEESIEKEEVILIEELEQTTYRETKTPFRFPLISDNEKDRSEDADLDDGEKEEEYQPLYMHKQWQQKRQNTVVHQATKPRVEHSSIPSPRDSFSTTRDSFQEVKPRITKVPVQSKLFVPSEVPSPIHGFNRPKISPIDDLLAKKNLGEVNKETAATIIEESESPSIKPSGTIIQQSEQEMKKHQPITEKEIVRETPFRSKISPFDELLAKKNQIKVVEQEASVFVEVKPTETNISKQVESEMLEQSATIEKEVVNESHVKVEEQLDVEMPSAIDGQVTDIPLTEKKKKSLPFNVMMLNSDKAKYQQATTRTNMIPTIMPKQEIPNKPIEQQPVDAPVERSTGQDQQPDHAIVEDSQPGYIFPRERYLVPPEQKTQDNEWMSMQAARLIESLSYFQVKAEIVNMVQGPAVTQFEITVGQGTKVSKIRNLADDLKLALAAKDIRIQAPIPGKSSIGIEIPNQTSRPVRLSEVVGSSNFTDSDSPLEAALGLDLTGTPITIDLRKMPHGLIAGATGSGKSVCINSLLISLLYKATPKELNLLLIDPKMVELAPFNHIPHLVSPVITDVKAATAALKWAVEEMERRYQLFAHTGVRDITRYNAMAEEKRQFAQKMPYLLIVIDELADLMMMAPTEVEESICRIAQKARACGIHLVVATQRPSVDVITGLIKANIPTRIAFSVSSQIDSRTILDVQGAERLLGRGDMLYLGNGMSAPIRIQGTYVTDEEMEEIIEHARSQGEPSYLFEQEELVRRLEVAEDQDELFEEACRFILEQGSASTSLLQRKFHIGYNRAARLVDLMEQHGYVSESRGSKAREVFITENDLQLLFNE